ncbi:MAG: RNA polymerase sigma factor [Gemmatimonadetes bacterium]|nr:RNA polymerase sigma factor [Gemmatimonadota bacterium]
MGSTTDVRLAADGDARAFERLYHEHVPRVHSLARRMVGSAEADELTQDVFVLAWRKLDTFRGDAAFSTWLHRVAINVMLGYRKTKSLERERYVAAENVVERLQTRPASTEISVDMEAAIETLPGKAREVFVLHDIEGYKHEEIADMLDIAAGTSKSQLHRARMLLREQLTA